MFEKAGKKPNCPKCKKVLNADERTLTDADKKQLSSSTLVQMHNCLYTNEKGETKLKNQK